MKANNNLSQDFRSIGVAPPPSNAAEQFPWTANLLYIICCDVKDIKGKQAISDGLWDSWKSLIKLAGSGIGILAAISAVTYYIIRIYQVV